MEVKLSSIENQKSSLWVEPFDNNTDYIKLLALIYRMSAVCKTLIYVFSDYMSKKRQLKN